MRKFALSYYLGMLILALFISASLLHYITPIQSVRHILQVIAILALIGALLFAVWIAWKAENHGK